MIDGLSRVDPLEIDFKWIPCLRDCWGRRCVGGIPCLTDDLMWNEEVPLFFTRRLARLKLGPGLEIWRGRGWERRGLLGRLESCWGSGMEEIMYLRERGETKWKGGIMGMEAFKQRGGRG